MTESYIHRYFFTSVLQYHIWTTIIFQYFFIYSYNASVINKKGGLYLVVGLPL